MCHHSVSNQGTYVIYEDGSCLDCLVFSGGGTAFTSTPGVLSAVETGKVIEYGVDGAQKKTVASGGVSGAAWSAQGKLAVVRSNEVLAGRPGRLRPLGRGTSPSWAPSGSRLVLVRRAAYWWWASATAGPNAWSRGAVRPSPPTASGLPSSCPSLAQHHVRARWPGPAGRQRPRAFRGLATRHQPPAHMRYA
jgi:hypothetical protein